MVGWLQQRATSDQLPPFKRRLLLGGTLFMWDPDWVAIRSLADTAPFARGWWIPNVPACVP
jgi:hypothetical protein